MSDDSDDFVPEESTEEFPSEHERPQAEHVEETLTAMEAAVQGSSYPTNASDLRAAYATERDEVVNETEALADVFDRLVPEEYDTPEDAREAILGELTGRAGIERGDLAEYNPERELDAMDLVEDE
ncbi:MULTISPECIES: hypothetical protein [Halobacterium]|uniref:hypothetical protein n=1 Tax=Halobacterium TaxID=2239 RepID=UPI00073E13C8|nr:MULTISPECIES: hypothetical protein [Halobacterium]MCG1004504.1 hypothetical protein [Halobacterium noricense]